MRPDDGKRLSNLQIGLIAIVLTVIGFYLAFAKSIPFTGDGYQLKAVFQDAQNIRAKSPVRIAGVDVGEVTKVEHLHDENGDGVDAAVVTMSLEDSARPLRDDATMALRPRLFLEGNLFVDVNPGSPGAEELPSGSVIPLERTSYSVQLDQVLTSLQAPVRDQLQVFLKEFGDGLDQYGGAEGFREWFRTSPAAYGATAQVNEALLGRQPGDLVGFVRNFGTVIRALDRNEVQLQDLITNFRIVTGSFASESEALEEAIVELPQLLAAGRPALAKLNTAFPALRAFAREALPGVKAAGPALDDANPFIGQLRQLVSPPELRGLVDDLRPTIPDLARLAQATPPFFEQARALSSCFNNVIIPWGNTDVPSASNPAGKVFEETGYSLAGVAGESRSGDANGQYFRVLGGGGTNTISLPPIEVAPGDTEGVGGVVPFELIGAQPSTQSSAKTPFRPDLPCETQDPPNLGNTPGAAPATRDSGVSPTYASPEVSEISAEYARIFTELMKADALEQGGAPGEAAEVRAAAQAAMREFMKTQAPNYIQAIAEFTGVDVASLLGGDKKR
jgi:phospholipid/cholesterol/gamma-HCH transport system substrate-binding protein